MDPEVLRRIRCGSWLACWLALSGCMPDGTVIDPKSLMAGSSGAAGLQPPAAGAGAMIEASRGFAGSGASGAAGNAGPRAGTGSLAAGSGGSGAAGGSGAPRGAGRSGAGGAAGTGAAGAGAAMGGSGGAGRSSEPAATGGTGAAGRSAAAGEGGSAGGNASGTATFGEIYALFVESCNGCHGPGDGGLKMSSEDEAYMNLVNVDARSCSGQKRVVPGDPQASVLFLAVDRSSAGNCNPTDMPRNAAKWSQANIDKLKAWIAAGAPKN